MNYERMIKSFSINEFPKRTKRTPKSLCLCCFCDTRKRLADQTLSPFTCWPRHFTPRNTTNEFNCMTKERTECVVKNYAKKCFIQIRSFSTLSSWMSSDHIIPSAAFSCFAVVASRFRNTRNYCDWQRWSRVDKRNMSSRCRWKREIWILCVWSGEEGRWGERDELSMEDRLNRYSCPLTFLNLWILRFVSCIGILFESTIFGRHFSTCETTLID